MTESLPALIESAKRALDAAVSFDEVKFVRDKAEALRFFAKSIGAAAEASTKCAEIKLRAERWMGQELGKLDLAKGRPEKMSQDATFNPKLSELGVTRSESSRWQAVARIPEPAFESFITSTKEITTAGALKLAGAARRGTSARAVPTGGRQAESANTAGHGRRPIDVLWSAWNACLEQEQREFLTSIGVDESDDDDDEDDSDNDGEPADGIYEIEFNSGDIVGLRPGMIGRAPSPQSKTPAT